MKKTLSVVLAFVLAASLLAGCDAKTEKVINPLPETLDITALDNCTVAVSLEKGAVKLSEDGKAVMDVTVYSYELYDMVDIASLEENDAIVRKNEKVSITDVERLDSGLVRINGGEENGGFDLASNDGTIYYEVGMNNAKAYYELGKVTLSVSDDFEYVDESDPEAGAKTYLLGELLATDAGIEYDFRPNNTSVVIENGAVIKMNKIYMP